MPKTVKNDITGLKFSRLLVIKFIPDESRFSSFLCLCDCGVQKVIKTQSIIRGLTKSCGCLQKEEMRSRKTHGHSGIGRTKTYNSWAGMMDRCEWGGHPSYENYGAVGIRVDKRWFSYEVFLQDMGERPEGTSIDRKDNTKGYSIENCRWATRQEQALNTSRTIKIMYKGELTIFHYLCEKLGLSKKAIHARAVRRGNDYVAALRSVGVDCDYATAAIRGIDL